MMLKFHGTVNRKRPFVAVVAAVAALSLFTTPPARAQDAHYGSIQNGSQATLLGGAVVANDPDLSAAYYNPGALARHAEASALSMFAKTCSVAKASSTWAAVSPCAPPAGYRSSGPYERTRVTAIPTKSRSSAWARTISPTSSPV
jgi:hypothetical protein